MSRPYKVQLIAPISEGFQGRAHVFSLPFMSLPTLAAYTPEDVEQTLVHEKHSDVDYDADVDLVGITCMTPCTPRAFEIADRFRARGVKVVMGGVHATVMPDEVRQHADAICIGEGETVWADIINDARGGGLKDTYKNPNIRMRDFTLKTPRRDLLPVGQYFGGRVRAIFMETTRGCPYDCDFCAVTTFFGQQYRCRSVDEIEAELHDVGIRELKPGQKRSYLNTILALTDDNFMGNLKHAVAVMEMLRKYDVRWFGQSTLRFSEKPDLLKLCQESGCLGFEIGFETLHPKKYRKTGRSKELDQAKYYVEQCKVLHEHGIGINGSLMLGNDDDDLNTFGLYADFIQAARIQTPYLTIRTPYPGTPLYYEMEEDGRLLHREWEKYDTAHAVFQPIHMTAEQLEAGYRWTWRKVTSHWNMLRRNVGVGPLFRFWGAAALGFRISTRLEHGKQERRHPSKLDGRATAYLPPPREGVPEMPAHILELRKLPDARRAAADGSRIASAALRPEPDPGPAQRQDPPPEAGRSLPIL